MATFVLRGIDPELWQKVQTRAKADGVPMRGLALRLFELYAHHGLPALEARATASAPRKDTPDADK